VAAGFGVDGDVMISAGLVWGLRTRPGNFCRLQRIFWREGPLRPKRLQGWQLATAVVHSTAGEGRRGGGFWT
jgi:hypothetical protein